MTWENAVALLGVCAVIITAIIGLRRNGDMAKTKPLKVVGELECHAHSGLFGAIERHTTDISTLSKNQSAMMVTLTRIETKLDLFLKTEQET